MIKFDEDTLRMITEISAMSGIQRAVIKEIFEYLLLYWAEAIAKADGKMAILKVPLLGNVSVKYKGDIINKDGTLGTEVQQFVNISDFLKKLIGDIHDEKYNEVDKLLKKKINSALSSLIIGK